MTASRRANPHINPVADGMAKVLSSAVSRRHEALQGALQQVQRSLGSEEGVPAAGACRDRLQLAAG